MRDIRLEAVNKRSPGSGQSLKNELVKTFQPMGHGATKPTITLKAVINKEGSVNKNNLNGL